MTPPCIGKFYNSYFACATDSVPVFSNVNTSTRRLRKLNFSPLGNIVCSDRCKTIDAFVAHKAIDAFVALKHVCINSCRSRLYFRQLWGGLQEQNSPVPPPFALVQVAPIIAKTNKVFVLFSYDGVHYTTHNGTKGTYEYCVVISIDIPVRLRFQVK